MSGDDLMFTFLPLTLRTSLPGLDVLLELGVVELPDDDFFSAVLASASPAPAPPATMTVAAASTAEAPLSAVLRVSGPSSVDVAPE